MTVEEAVEMQKWLGYLHYFLYFGYHHTYEPDTVKEALWDLYWRCTNAKVVFEK